MTPLHHRTSDYLIPRWLHQTYFTEDLPPNLADNVRDLRHANPDWQYRLYDDKAVTAFILCHYGREMLMTFEMISPVYGAARADLFRYLLMYQAGGVYLDVKSRFVVPISSVIKGDEGYVIAQWREASGEPREGWGRHAELAGVPGGEFQQWHIIAAAGHPFLRAVIERVVQGIETYRPRREETGWLGVLRLTGPIAYTRAIAPLIGHYPCRRVPDETALCLDYSILDNSDHKSLFRHHYTRSTAPVVRRPGLLGVADRAYVEVRARKRRWWRRSG